MTERRIIDMMVQIDSYVRGTLHQNDIDQLCIEFLKEPEWFKIFEVELHLRMMITKQSLAADGELNEI